MHGLLVFVSFREEIADRGDGRAGDFALSEEGDDLVIGDDTSCWGAGGWRLRRVR